VTPCDVSAAVSQQIFWRRMRAGWTQAELARRMTDVGCHFTREIVAKLEARRRRDMTVDELVAAAAAFGVSPAELLTSALERPFEGVGALYRPWRTDDEQ
jgi:transcriptional regulator with XRE-family HTH domain